MRRFRRHVGLRWVVLGLLGSLAVAVAATGLLRHRPTTWWWQLPLGGHGVEWHVFWGGVIVLCVAWLGLGRRLSRSSGARSRDVIGVAALWALPLLVAPALFSLDMYSYLAQGALLHHGTNPYRVAPEALASWHRTALLGSVSPVWRHTTAPYGPLFLWLAGAVAGLAGSHVTAGVTLLRLLELPGLALLGVFVPRLARRAGGDPIRATWLVLASPLTLLYLVGGGHNDALMAGLLVAGVTLALDRRPLAAIALCTLATAVKLPAAAGLALVVACWLRAEPAARRRLRAAGIAAGTAVAVGLACGLVAGVGVSWISGDLFSTPASVRFALTPATALAVSVWELGHGVHPWVGVAAAPLEAAFTRACFGLCAAIGLWFAWRVRRATLVRDLGVVLLAAALLGPAAWPWYLSWGLALLACDRVVQRRRWPVALGVAAVFPVMAGGQVAVALPAAPRVLVVYVTLGVAAGVTLLRRHVHRRHHLDHAGRHDPPRLATSELAG